MKTYTAFTDENNDLQVSVSQPDGSSYILDYRLDLVKHSPDGFATGYLGSGPAQLALALLADALRSDERALDMYQQFKAERIANIPSNRSTWHMTEYDIEEWVKAYEYRNRQDH